MSRRVYSIFAACLLIAAFVFTTPGATKLQSKGLLLVLNKFENKLAIVDPVTLQVKALIPTGEGPHEVAASADGKYAYVSNYGTGPAPGNSLSIIDIAAAKEIRRLDLGPLIRPHGIMESGGNIYFTSEVARVAARFNPGSDPATGKVDWIMGTGQDTTHMLVVAPDSSKIYTADITAGTVTLIRLKPERGVRQVEHIATGAGTEGIDISPDGRELWAAHQDDGGMAIIDTATNKVVADVKAGKRPIRVKFTPNGKRVLVSDAEGGVVIVYDAATRQEVKRIEVPNVPVGMVMQPDGSRVYVSENEAKKVAVIDLNTLTLVGTINPGDGPDGLAWAKM